MSLPFHDRDNVRVDAFVLAGGRSSRLGQDKALISLAGVPLIQRALEILRAAGLNPRIAGAAQDLSSFASVIPDDPQRSGLGPLSGICSALSVATARYSVFLPVDLPLIPASLISYLLYHTLLTGSGVTLVSVSGFIQTFPAIIHRDASSTLRAILDSSDRKSLTAFQAAAKAIDKALSVLPIEFLSQAGQFHLPHGLFPAQAFLNVNTPHDIARAEGLLAAIDLMRSTTITVS